MISETASQPIIANNPRSRLILATVVGLASLIFVATLAMKYPERDQAEYQNVAFEGYVYQPTQSDSPAAFLLGKANAATQDRLTKDFVTAMHGEHWLWFSPKNIKENLKFLQIELAWLDRVSIFYFYDDGLYETYEAGDEDPFERRIIAFRKPVFPLHRTINQREVNSIALRISAQGRFSLPLSALSDTAFNHQANLDYLFYGAWIAILIALGFYNATIFFSLRSDMHLYYFIYVMVFTVLLVTASGVGQQYIWPGSQNLTTLIANISLALTNYGTAFFVIHFLRLKDINRRLTSLLIWPAYISLLCVPLIFVFGYNALVPILMCSFVIMLFILPAAVYATLKGSEVGPFLLASLIILLPCNTIGLIRFMGFFENLHWTEHLPELGLVADALILSLALAYKVNLLRREKDEINQLRETDGIEFAKRLIHAKEQERKTIGKALHDDLGHKVLSIKSAVQSIPDQQNLSYKNESLELLDDAIKQVRDLSHLLYPSIIEHIGLEKAVSSVVSKGLSAKDIDYTVEVAKLALSSELELLLYRAAQEFTNNIVKHSNASIFKLSITEKVSVNEIVMTATDNGEALFDSEDFGFGLNMLKQQAGLFDGELVAKRTRGGWNRLTLNVFIKT